MIKFKGSGLSKSEESEVRSICADLKDVYSDFYLTHQNVRLFILDNIDILFEGLKKGDKIVWDENGIIVIVGYSDNSPRKYLKILTKDLKHVQPLLQALFWNIHKAEDFFIKLKTDVKTPDGKIIQQANPLKDELLKYRPLKENGKLIRSGFEFFGGRGKECLLKHCTLAQKTEAQRVYSKDKDE